MIGTQTKPEIGKIRSDTIEKLRSNIIEKFRKLQSSLPPRIDIAPAKSNFAPPPDPNYVPSLLPYAGAWTLREAKHLLRRTTFGYTPNDVDQILDMGMTTAINTLLRDLPSSDPPLNSNYENDSLVPIGDAWIYKGISAITTEQVVEIISYRRQSILSWQMGKMLDNQLSVREKMTLFWHNHIPVADIEDPDYLYKYISLLESSALGNFKQLIKDITIDPSMLRYLNGNQNTKNAPNENYARELLELFTIGKGNLAGPGDYSTFTEQDVEALAKILTGWKDRRPEFGQPGEPDSTFIGNLHDQSNKQLSHRFGNAIINNNGLSEYSDAIDVIFLQDEVSKFFCRNIYRWFVYYQIDEAVESNIIEPLAAILRENNFEVKPVLNTLLRSSHFYDVSIHGAMIKNPYDYMFGLFAQFGIDSPQSLDERYRYWIILFFVGQISEMEYFNPPSVAGWKAYYQQPTYYQTWINSVTLAFRKLIVDVNIFTGISNDGFQYTDSIDVIAFMEQGSNPSNINSLLTEFGDHLHSKSLTQEQKDQLKEILIPGLPDFEWTEEYNAWKSNPNDPTTRTLITQKLQLLLRSLMSMPEYHLS